MGDAPVDRRARKKARTHDELRVVAQRLFAERGFDAVTVADVADAADVAVQTVFNHYPTKEDLYFAGRAPWVAGPARAVAHRAPGTGAVATAHAWISRHVLAVPGLLRRPDGGAFAAATIATPALRVHQRELLRDGEDRLARALRETWVAQLGDLADLRLVAALTSALLLTSGRVALAEQVAVIREADQGLRGTRAVAEEARRRSRPALDAVGTGFAQLTDRPDTPAAFRRVAELERGLPADLRVARRTDPGTVRREP
ncbi:TetR family transcriptional regulator [Klenkia brasiliensis]|uniref:Transcriptional regulator, TetR family n=1 Tax=Klenkia brasiliensis TaxID=333142 RepID=A0A1G7MX42_9ACTN|nr:TetR family transcriptional regulator [Klenkia brasiliensis]SDF66363.1 transcriptional regulator, TetR family [Klenkia brasiliensis]